MAAFGNELRSLVCEGRLVSYNYVKFFRYKQRLHRFVLLLSAAAVVRIDHLIE